MTTLMGNHNVKWVGVKYFRTKIVKLIKDSPLVGLRDAWVHSQKRELFDWKATDFLIPSPF